MMQSNPMNLTLPDLSQSITLPPQACCPAFPSSPTTLLINMLLLITTTKKCLAD